MGLEQGNHVTDEISRTRSRVYQAESELKEAEAALKRVIDDHCPSGQQYAAQSQ